MALKYEHLKSNVFQANMQTWPKNFYVNCSKAEDFLKLCFAYTYCTKIKGSCHATPCSRSEVQQREAVDSMVWDLHLVFCLKKFRIC